ncbi:MAG: diguanylate cyclase [Pseudoxanthomonas sp.]
MANEHASHDANPATSAVGELERLQERTSEARLLLASLQDQVAAARASLEAERTSRLVEANEHLVLAMLRAQADAETSAQVLDEVSRSVKLDALTSLPNRLLLLDRFTQAIAIAKRHGTRLALLFMDINHFKQINDTLGHATGDAVLKLVALRLATSVSDADTVSRHGGDEFLILLPEVSQASDATRIASKIIAALSAPCRVGEHVLRLTASIGISIYPDDGDDAQLLINRADAAMYRAKRQGLGSFVFHHEAAPLQQNLQQPAVTALLKPLSHYQEALAEHEQRYVQLREANQQLVLAALNAQELQAASEQAQKRQTEFLAVLAHELRTPLTPIRIAATMMDGKDKHVLPRMQAIIEQQVVHMTRLVSDLLDVSRANTGKLTLEYQILDMTGVIDQAIGACRPAMDARMQHFVIQVPACPLWVHGDPVRLAQVFVNLLDNASKYTPQGGEIQLSVQIEGTTLITSISDSGIGITAEALPKVFEPFAQDAQASGFNRDGLGIGLTVVRELVTAHGGNVVASSAGSGQGSRFVVTLPLTSNPALHGNP